MWTKTTVEKASVFGAYDVESVNIIIDCIDSQKICTSTDFTLAILDYLGGRNGITGEFRYATLGIQILAGIIEKARKSTDHRVRRCWYGTGREEKVSDKNTPG